MQKRTIAAIGLLLGTALASRAEEPVKIGFISTFTGAQAMLGSELLDGFKLGIEASGGKLGGREVELVIGDDQAKPDVGRQLAEKVVEQDRVDIVTGINFSNVTLSAARPVLRSKTPLISLAAGPSQLAGKDCDPYFFNLAWQNDGAAEAMGAYLESKGVQNIALMAPNYPAGKDLMAGFKRFYHGKIIDEVYTGFSQLDYAAELAQLRSSGAEAVFFFYPGTWGINFLKQFADAGLKDKIKLYGPAFSLDQTIFPAVGDAPIGAFASSFWIDGLDNPPNKAFVKAFTEKFGRLPSGYSAQAYDTARFIDSALKKLGNGSLKDKEALRAAIKSTTFESVRGPFRFNNNNFPIQNYYIAQIEKDPQGRTTLAMRDVALRDHADAYAKECALQ